MDSLGLSATGTRSDNTVSRGIESITETQASALEALMTSTRFSVESIDDSVNTMLSLVRSQGMHLEEIARLVSSVYYPGHHSRGPGAIKVVVD